MGLRIDLHVHTNRYSMCSKIDPLALIPAAVKSGLDGLVITDHARQWTEPELEQLRQAANEPGFLLLSGFEYTSTCGDILIYGLPDHIANSFEPGLAPAEVLQLVRRLGGVCIAAHPTRAGMAFDERIINLPFHAIEVCSMRLTQSERTLALKIAEVAKFRVVAASDAHVLTEVGAYATVFDVPLRSMQDLLEALTRGTFHIQ